MTGGFSKFATIIHNCNFLNKSEYIRKPKILRIHWLT